MSQDMITLQIPMPVFVLTRLCADAEIGVPRGSRFQSMVWNGLLPAFVVNSEITFRGAYFSFNYLRFIWAPYQNALT